MAAVAAEETEKKRCQRIGCDAMFSVDENGEDSCRFHPGPPVFHDGGKQWSCCNQKSHDFSMFLELPGCKTGKHSAEKPQQVPTPTPKKGPTPLVSGNPGAAAACSRCRQGFFCSDHGSKLPRKVAPVAHPAPAPAPVSEAPVPAAVPNVADINAKQICKNKGCGKPYTEKENTETSCFYHPGPPVFRDRQRGWGCCDIHVTDFDEFLEIPPCTKGWHNANAK